MDRIRRLSLEVLDKHKSRFGENFTDNKKSLDQIAIVRSKGLKNEVAGYITNLIKKENREAEFNLSKINAPDEDTSSVPESDEVTSDLTQETEENVIEVGVEATETNPEIKDPSPEKNE